MDFDQFKILHSETLCFCQIIEGDLKWIYSFMHAGDVDKNYENLSKRTLGQVVDMLKELDKSSGNRFLSDNDYNFLKQMTEKRNYWCHICYREFMYESNFLLSESFEKVSQKLQKDHDKLEQVYRNVEQAKFRANETYPR